MSRFSTTPITVPLPGGCQCPGQPHAQDETYLLPRLTFDGGAAAEAVINRHLSLSPMDTDALGRDLVRAYLTHQVAGWNLVTEDGTPLPYDPALLLSDWETALAVGDRADDLYSEVLLAPLRVAVQKSLPAGPTGPSTSPRTSTASRPRKR